jgi:two-component system cell cycle response regulator DivK
VPAGHVVHKLKSSAATRHIPVIALSAHATFEDEQRARAAGCDAFFTKPLPPQDLLAAIRALHARAADSSRN